MSASPAAPVSVQERFFPDLRCFGCGPANAKGLRLRSFDAGDGTARADFSPWAEHDNGLGYLNGGIIATVLDCHCVCTAIANHYREDARPMTSDPLIWCVTAGLDVSYLSPTPIDRELVLRARLVERKGKKSIVECSLLSGGEERARARLVAIRVPQEWCSPSGSPDA